MKNIKALFKILKSILNHPFNKEQKTQSVIRFLKWQISTSLNKYTVIYPVTKNAVMIAEKGMTGITGCIYSGLLEFEEMMFTLHFLRADDLFVDVGANVGIYTVLASGEIGANTISIEPIKKTFDTLYMNIKINNIESRVRLLNIGLGSTEGELIFTTNEESVNHVVSDFESKLEIETAKVTINTLDNICINRKPNLVKIDVEGFETNVIHGAKDILGSPELKAIIIELNGSGSRYGFNEKDIHEKIISHGFSCFAYEPYSRKIIPMKTFGTNNTIYLRDLEFITSRVASAPKVSIINQEI